MAMKNDGGNAFYLFCLARSNLMSTVDGTGVDGRSPLFLWNHRDVTAVMSEVSLDDFCGEAAELNMQDLSWLGPRVCNHEKVIEQIASHSPVLPARFGTLFTSIGNVENLLEKHHGAVSEFLDWVTDKEEWAVKGMLNRSAAQKSLLSIHLARQEENLASYSPGIRYFQEQRIRAGVEKDLNRWLGETCKALADDLSPHCSDFCERRVLSTRASGSDKDMVLNWAFLVPRSVAADFLSQIAQANANQAARGLVFEVSGPWPPHSFSPSLSMEQEA